MALDARTFQVSSWIFFIPHVSLVLDPEILGLRGNT